MNTLKNQIQLIGNLGRDVQLKEFENGRKLATVPLATNDYYKNSEGERINETQWHNLIAWGKTAENMEQTLRKGAELAVKGKLVHRSYEDKEGNTKYVSEVLVKEFMRIGKDELSS